MNYNRDVEVFPVMKRILERISETESCYRSPTDMGVNRAGFGIVEDEVVREAARQEVIRRYFRCSCEYVMGLAEHETVDREFLLMEQLGVRPEDRKVVDPARRAAKEARDGGKGNEGIFVGAAVELAGGEIVTGKNSPLMHAASAVVLNAVKRSAEVPDKIHLLSPSVMESVARLKKEIMARGAVSLDLEETLIALSISATTNPTAEIALERLKSLRGCEMHMTHIPTPGDEAGLRHLGLNLTADPNHSTNNLFEG